MPNDNYIIITSINNPTKGIIKIEHKSKKWSIIVVGDKNTPENWYLNNVDYLSVKNQINMDSTYVRKCPYNSYSRKNIGYIKAIRAGAKIIAETDDDNIPYKHFLQNPEKITVAKLVKSNGWVNIYKFFSDRRIWPRGYPIELINESFKKSLLEEESKYDCPIQQYLANGNPDVDAIFRMTNKKSIIFAKEQIVLGNGSYCPFNSQNTIWWPEVFPLLYLPSHVTFRMTDIWRSIVAQICLYRLGKYLYFGEATVYQKRNEHSLIRDFQDEIPGYLYNQKILQALVELPLSPSPKDVSNNLLACYEKLVEIKIIPFKELDLLNCWLNDIKIGA